MAHRSYFFYVVVDITGRCTCPIRIYTDQITKVILAGSFPDWFDYTGLWSRPAYVRKQMFATRGTRLARYNWQVRTLNSLGGCPQTQATFLSHPHPQDGDPKAWEAFLAKAEQHIGNHYLELDRVRSRLLPRELPVAYSFRDFSQANTAADTVHQMFANDFFTDRCNRALIYNNSGTAAE